MAAERANLTVHAPAQEGHGATGDSPGARLGADRLDHRFHVGHLQRAAQIPDDWIAPGEFSYCGRCGHRDTLKPLPYKLRGPCARCSAREGRPRSGELELQLEIDRIVARHSAAMRDEIGRLRRDRGLPPLFWMPNDRSPEIRAENGDARTQRGGGGNL